MRRSLFRICLAVLALSTGLLGAQAQDKTTRQDQTPKKSVPVKKTDKTDDKSAQKTVEKPNEHILGPDDIIEITVANHEGYDKILTVLPDGTINYGEIGEIKAAGMTTKAIAARVQTELDKKLNNAKVNVALREIHSRHIRLLGPVRAPGTFDLKPGWHLLDLLAAAGGVGLKPSHVTCVIIRGADQIPVNLAEALAKPDTSANPILEPNDLILFTEIEQPHRVLNVMGQVPRQGLIEIDDDTTILSVLGQTGYPTLAAATSKAYVMRNGQQIPLNLHPLLKGQPDQMITKFKFQNNDVLYIPTVDQHYDVQGMVGRPTSYLMSEDGEIKVTDALNQAGGPAPNGDLSKAMILRNVNGKVTGIPVNIDNIYKKHDLAANVVLQPNDILYVPPRGKRGMTIGDIFGPISLLNILGFRFFGR
jgi:protein involved in polysaccharide export with SLBB domain